MPTWHFSYSALSKPVLVDHLSLVTCKMKRLDFPYVFVRFQQLSSLMGLNRV